MMLRSTVDAPSHSRMASVNNCERHYFLRYVRGLESPEQFAPAYMGSALHVGLEVFHRTGDKEAAIAGLHGYWGPQRFFGDWDWVTPGHAEVILKNYMDAKHAQDWNVVKLRWADLDSQRLIDTDVQEDADGFLMLAEASFIVDVPGLGPVLIKPDILLRVATGLRVGDHKSTTSYLGSKLYNRTKFEHQLRTYALAMGALLKEPVGEGFCNAIYAGKSAGFDKFSGKRFESYVFDYSPADFTETKAWYKASKIKMQTLAALGMQDELQAPQNPSDRCGYCDFAKLCSAPAALRPGLVRMHYKEKAA